jgi:anaerobic ribonucleoside-triphosphate reductase activating protein
MHLTKQYPSFTPYLKATCELYISGCSRNCPGCQNPYLSSFTYGEQLNLEKLIDYLEERKNLFSIISITGGDILCQPELEAMQFCSTLKLCFPDKLFWLFTGAEFEEIPKWYLKIFDVIKTGPYKEELKTDTFPASSNQKVLYKGKDF